jgi:hypothetical protein
LSDVLSFSKGIHVVLTDSKVCALMENRDGTRVHQVISSPVRLALYGDASVSQFVWRTGHGSVAQLDAFFPMLEDAVLRVRLGRTCWDRRSQMALDVGPRMEVLSVCRGVVRGKRLA